MNNNRLDKINSLWDDISQKYKEMSNMDIKSTKNLVDLSMEENNSDKVGLSFLNLNDIQEEEIVVFNVLDLNNEVSETISEIEIPEDASSNQEVISDVIDEQIVILEEEKEEEKVFNLEEPITVEVEAKTEVEPEIEVSEAISELEIPENTSSNQEVISDVVDDQIFILEEENEWETVFNLDDPITVEVEAKTEVEPEIEVSEEDYIVSKVEQEIVMVSEEEEVDPDLLSSFSKEENEEDVDPDLLSSFSSDLEDGDLFMNAFAEEERIQQSGEVEKDDDIYSISFTAPSENLDTKTPEGWDFLFNLDLDKEEDPVITPVGQFNMSTALGEEVVKEEIVVSVLPDVLEELEDSIPIIQKLLPLMKDRDPKVLGELHRVIHTIKGSVGQVGAKKARAVLHHMESVMEEVEAGIHKPEDKQQELLDLFDRFLTLIKPLQTGDWAKSSEMSSVETLQDAQQMPKTVRISTDTIDKMVSDVNESRLMALALMEFHNVFKSKLKDFEEDSQKMSRLLRDLELQAEIQIQSRQTQLQDMGKDFDPLEMDQFTKLQEMSRLMSEVMSDISEGKKDLAKIIADYETTSAQQFRLIESSQEELHKTRLLPADTINDRLYNDVKNTSKEVGKEVTFEMIGSRTELDRVFLEKIKGPMGHILKNSVVHGIESPEERKKLGKTSKGHIAVRFRQLSGRVIIEISDDGYGIRVNKVREKAIEKGLWDKNKPMTDADAADMICNPGFSTADGVSELAGRGVGMDAVRKDILELGGRFEIKSVETKGMTITIQLPASVASASVLVVDAGDNKWAIPVEMIEHVMLVSIDKLKDYGATGLFTDHRIAEWNGSRFKSLSNEHHKTATKKSSFPVMLIKDRGQLLALEASKLVQIFEVPLRPAGTIWNKVQGVAGSVILPNGDAVFLLDPFIYTAASNNRNNEISDNSKNIPMVMVVDDSLTVRKASGRFLQKNGYQSIMAKDGQEALDLLLKIRPSIILMDIEMPRMDGFTCTENIRQNDMWKDIPIVMITSRSAEKHRRHAKDIGVNEYLGKPFKEVELLKILQKYCPR